jgi:hypothetical protein
MTSERVQGPHFMEHNKMPKRIKQGFPAQIYVRRETDGDDTYLLADEEKQSGEDGEQIAIYVLQEVKTKRITHLLD